MPLALRGGAVSRAWLSDRHQRGPGRRYRLFRRRGMCRCNHEDCHYRKRGRRETCTAGWRVTRDGIVPSGEVVERSWANSVVELGEVGGSRVSTGHREPRRRCPRRSLKPLFPAGNATEPPANHRHPSSPNPPGTKFAEILCLSAWHCVKEAVWWRSFVFSADADRRWGRSLTKMWRRSATSRACLSRARAGSAGSRSREESENNLPDLLDRSAMHPHNRQFSTEGCPSG